MMDTGIHAQGYENTPEILKTCIRPEGFIACPVPIKTYHRARGSAGDHAMPGWPVLRI